jgi:hypothetical protein
MDRMKKLLIILVFVAAAGPLAAQCSSCSKRVVCPGPEITGNYATPYLTSPCTGESYADPMYYYASDALARWHQIRPRTRARARVQTEVTTERCGTPRCATQQTEK